MVPAHNDQGNLPCAGPYCATSAVEAEVVTAATIEEVDYVQCIVDPSRVIWKPKENLVMQSTSNNHKTIWLFLLVCLI
jgi:hypothetical protein